MKRRSSTCAICVGCAALLLVASPVHCITALGQKLSIARPEEAGVSSERAKELSAYQQALINEGRIVGGVTMLARHGKVVHLQAIGMADRDAKKPMTTDAIFRIASMTKPVTSVAIMMLWEDNELGLDDPVSNYIPEFGEPEVLVNANPLKTRPAKREITIRDLLTHTSGITYPGPDQLGTIYQQHGLTGGLGTTDITLELMILKLADMPLLFDPGTRFQYGMSTDVLGRVVEVVSGKPLDQFFRAKILDPLSMNDTFFKVPPDKKDRLVATYIPTDNGLKKLEDGEFDPDKRSGDYPYAETHKFLSGGGGLCSTPSDYLRFCQMLLNGGKLDGQRLLKKETVQLMTQNQIGDIDVPDANLPDQFGFGFTIYPDAPDVHEQLRDAYAWYGFWTTSFRISPRGDWILITMAQAKWDDENTLKWFNEYERMAAEAIKP